MPDLQDPEVQKATSFMQVANHNQFPVFQEPIRALYLYLNFTHSLSSCFQMISFIFHSFQNVHTQKYISSL